MICNLDYEIKGKKWKDICEDIESLYYDSNLRKNKESYVKLHCDRFSFLYLKGLIIEHLVISEKYFYSVNEIESKDYRIIKTFTGLIKIIITT